MSRHRRERSQSSASSCSSSASTPASQSQAPPPALVMPSRPQPLSSGPRINAHHVGVMERSHEQHHDQLQHFQGQQQRRASVVHSSSNQALRVATAASRTGTVAAASPNGSSERPTTRPRTSSERGRVFRLRQKQYEKDLEAKVRLLRSQVAQLQHLRGLLVSNEGDLLSRNESLVRLVRELHLVLRHGLQPKADTSLEQIAHSNGSIDQVMQDQAASTEYKESFLRRVLEPDVRFGDLVGVDAVIDQMRKHTGSYSKFEIELKDVQTITSVERVAIVVSSWKLHVRFLRESLSAMFPLAVEQIPKIAAKFLDRDFTLDCATRFQFAASGKIRACILETNFVEALVKEFGSAGDVVTLIQHSVATRDATLMRTRTRSDREEELRPADQQYQFVRNSRVRACGDAGWSNRSELPPSNGHSLCGQSHEEYRKPPEWRGRDLIARLYPRDLSSPIAPRPQVIQSESEDDVASAN